MFGLSFLYPLFLLGALAVAIPIALHLLRRRTEKVVEFPAVRLLHKAPVQQQRRRRLREIILLALRVAALALARAGVCTAVRRGAHLGAAAADDRRRPRYVPEPLGAGTVHAGTAGGAPRDRHGARLRTTSRSSPLPTRRRWWSRRPAIAAALEPPSMPQRPAPAARAFARRSHARRKWPPQPGADASSLSPTCSRRGGKRATKALCPTASRSRWSRCRRRLETSPSPPRIATDRSWWRRFTTSASVRRAFPSGCGSTAASSRPRRPTWRHRRPPTCD